jgi:hypothetical protein
VRVRVSDQLGAEDRAAIKRLLANVPSSGNDRQWLGSFEACRLWRVPRREGGTLQIIFAKQTMIIIPSHSSVRMDLFDGEDRHLRTQVFRTGWRIAVWDAECQTETDHGFPVVRVISYPVINGMPITGQVYALAGDDLFLIRLEDSEGKIVRNWYFRDSEPDFGAPMPRSSLAQWEKGLLSSDKVDVLRRLMWLGGVHRRSEPPVREGYAGEDAEDSKLFEKLHAHDGIRRAIAGLQKSEDPWIHEAAALAAEPQYHEAPW